MKQPPSDWPTTEGSLQPEQIYRLCGQIEVAAHIMGRATLMYLRWTDTPDSKVVEMLTRCSAVLAEGIASLEGESRPDLRLVP